MRERTKQQSYYHEQRKVAAQLLEAIYYLSLQAYVQGLERYHIDARTAQQKIEHLSHRTRRQKWEFVTAALIVNPEFTAEMSPLIPIISQLFEDEPSSTIASEDTNPQEGSYVTTP